MGRRYQESITSNQRDSNKGIPAIKWIAHRYVSIDMSMWYNQIPVRGYTTRVYKQPHNT